MSAPFIPNRSFFYENRYTLAVIIVALNVLDVILTIMVLNAGGEETNPILRPHMDGNGWIVLKLAIAIGTAALVVAGIQLGSRVAAKVGVAAIAFYCIVAAWNVGILVGA